MKYKLLILSVISLSLFLSGCSLDEMFETNQQHDGDDINVVRDIWPQALDQMLQSEDEPSITQWLKQPTQATSVNTASSQPTNQEINQQVTTQTPIVEETPVSQNASEREDSSFWEDD